MEKGDKVLLNTETTGTEELVAVPDVTGIDTESAKQMLEAVGFSCYVYSAPVSYTHLDVYKRQVPATDT